MVKTVKMKQNSHQLISEAVPLLCDDNVIDMTMPLVKETVDPALSTKGDNQEGEAAMLAEEFSIRKIPGLHKWTLILICVANLSAATCFSLMGPFFPSEVREVKSIINMSCEVEMCD